jgi:hypothetical protein
MTERKPKYQPKKWETKTATASAIAGRISDLKQESETVEFIARFVAKPFDLTDEEQEEFVCAVLERDKTYQQMKTATASAIAGRIADLDYEVTMERNEVEFIAETVADVFDFTAKEEKEFVRAALRNQDFDEEDD